MKGVSLRILFAMVLLAMCILFGPDYTGCNGATSVVAHIEDRADEAVLDQNFKIKYGQELTVKGEGLKVKFISGEDHRCPADVVCHSAGFAKILIGVRRANEEESRMELGINGEAKYQQYVFRLVALAPYPRIHVKRKRGDGFATLLIKKE